MYKFQQNKLLFSLALVPVVITSNSFSSQSLVKSTTVDSPLLPQNFVNLNEKINSTSNSKFGQVIAQNTSGNWIGSFWRRQPKRIGGIRSGRSGNDAICAISPGLLETYQVWSDQPLFLWQSQGKNKDVQLTLRDYYTQEEVWTQKVNIADQKVSYSGKEPLKPGKRYQWQLSGSQTWATFEIMPADQRNQIQLDLQAIEQKLKANKATTEEIALKKADYFINYEIKHKNEPGIFHPWSDALQILYTVENASPSFIKEREAYIANLCTDSTSTNSQK